MSDEQDRLREALHEAADAADLPIIDWTSQLAALRARRQRARRGAMAGVLAVTVLVAGVAVARNGVGGGRGVHSGTPGSDASDPTAVAPTPAPTEGTAMSSYGYATADISPAWYTLAAPPINVREGMAATWTGSEYIVWDGRTDAPDGAAYDPAMDEWRTIAASPLSARADVVTAWTGSKLIVWGGVPLEDGAAPLDDGALYDPVADEWYAMEPLPGSGRRASNTAAVWDGEELLVWGGGTEPNDGAAYNPTTNTWRPLPAAPIGWRDAPAGVWTSAELVVWGGSRTVDGQFENLADGAAYSPVTDTWEVLPEAPMQAAVVDAAWTGTQVVFTAGYSGDPNGVPLALDTGGVYDPATRTWTAAKGLTQHPGTQLLAVNGQVLSTAKGHSALLDPTTGAASDVLGDELSGGVDAATAVWTGAQVLALTLDGHGLIGMVPAGPPAPVACAVAEATPAAPAPTASVATANEAPVPAESIAEGTEEPATDVVADGSASDSTVDGDGPSSAGAGGGHATDPIGTAATAAPEPAELIPNDPAWSVTAGTLAPSSPGWSGTLLPLGYRTETVTAWTGSEYVVWGGTDGATVFADGVVVDPATGDVRAMSPAPIDARTDALAVWTGSEVLVIGGYADAAHTQSRGLGPAAAYDPATNFWRMLTMPPKIDGAHAFSPAAWTGDALLVLTDELPADGRSTSGAYYPPDNYKGQTPPPLPFDESIEPSSQPLTVWTGSEWLVAGRLGGRDVVAALRAPYSAAEGSTWEIIATAPTDLVATAAVWTGTEVLFAGGGEPGAGTYGTSVLDPVTGEWRELAATPYHPGAELVWTGSQAMFVLKGGYGLLDPATGDVTEQQSPVALQPGTGHGTGDGAVFLGEVTLDACTVGLAVARYQP